MMQVIAKSLENGLLKKYRAVLELGVWLMVFLFPLVLFKVDTRQPVFLLEHLLQTALVAALYYALVLCVIPDAYRNNPGRFVRRLLLVYAVFLGLQGAADQCTNRLHQQLGLTPDVLVPPALPRADLLPRVAKLPEQAPLAAPPAGITPTGSLGTSLLNESVVFIITFAFGLLITLQREHLRRTKRMEALQRAKVQAELQFLKSQISPHFIFNTLNSICALARKKSPLTEPALIELAKLMRFVLYDAGRDLIPLEKEVSYVRNYIDLQKLRFPDALVPLSIAEPVPDLYIAPMLLATFVENAFKHGAGTASDPLISLSLEMKGNALCFAVSNRVGQGNGQPDELTQGTGGIGLENIRKRLDLLYPFRYRLEVTRQPEMYTVTLTLHVLPC